MEETMKIIIYKAEGQYSKVAEYCKENSIKFEEKKTIGSITNLFILFGAARPPVAVIDGISYTEEEAIIKMTGEDYRLKGGK
jgi:hypothetical protein